MSKSLEPIRLVIVDDHRMLLGALAEWLRTAADDIDLVAAVPSWPELLWHSAFPADVALLDLDLRDNIPIAVKLATLRQSGMRTVLMSTYSDPPKIREALRAGALGYLVKSEPVENIVEAIRIAHSGERFLTPELAHEILIAEHSAPPKLSEQERQVMALYTAGRSLRDVAAELRVTDETAKGYLRRARRKYRDAGFNVGTKVALRIRAIEDGILTPGQ